ncbi:MAG: hypothetical protein J2P50_02235 [Hyphomicrobiaceae bacterium]|nr:hypothetical protein [Hyphomicrobiaceae bacterium]
MTEPYSAPDARRAPQIRECGCWKPAQSAPHGRVGGARRCEVGQAQISARTPGRGELAHDVDDNDQTFAARVSDDLDFVGPDGVSPRVPAQPAADRNRRSLVGQRLYLQARDEVLDCRQLLGAGPTSPRHPLQFAGGDARYRELGGQRIEFSRSSDGSSSRRCQMFAVERVGEHQSGSVFLSRRLLALGDEVLAEAGAAEEPILHRLP